MKIKTTCLLLSFILTLISCANNPKISEESQDSANATGDKYSMTSVMAVHDEVMPKMGQISMLIDQLKPFADNDPDSAYADAMKELQKSHKAMMDWMGNIGEAFTSEEILKGAPLSEEKRAKLKLEAEQIAEVKELMFKSINEGKRLLEALDFK